MKKTLIILPLIISLMVLSVLGDTAPTCSITLPADNTPYTGTQTFNVALTSNGTGEFNVTGINVTVSSSVVGSNITSGTAGDGSSVNQTTYTVGVDTSTITDVKQTTVTANIIINDTTGALSKYYGSCTSTGVDFDNTDPVCSCTLDREMTEVLDAIPYDCSASSDTTDLTYSCIMTYSSTETETETDSVGRFDEADDLGEATLSCTVTDEVSKTNTCSDLTVTIQGSDDYQGAPSPGSVAKRNMAFIIIAVIVLAIIVIAVSSASMKKKKGKKKK